jgi:hypothetical protein
METTQKTASTDALRRKKTLLTQRLQALKTEASTWRDEWENIAAEMRPRGFRGTPSETNRADREKQRRIINFTPREAQRTLASGMMTGITPASRPWFRLTVGDPQLAEAPAVKEYLSQCERVLRDLLARSNVYNGLHNTYGDIGTFAVAAMHVEPDEEDGVRSYVFAVGSYYLAAGARGSVDTIFREANLTVAQLVGLFGLEACSRNVQHLYKEGQHYKRFDIVHAIYPNPDYSPDKVGPRGKRFCSDWWEASESGTELFLRQSGFAQFPVLCPRWSCTGDDVYGHGPGHDALGDCRALQQLERRAAQAVDKIVTPPMAAPTAARGTPISLLPGANNFVDGLAAGQALRPAVEIRADVINVVEMKIRQHEERIKRAFFAHLWLMISEQSGNMTATEVDQRREEKLQQLGAVLEGLNDELLDPLLDLLFEYADAAGLLPPPPEELQGTQLKPEYISIMAAAQKMLATTGLQRLAVFVIQLASAKPDVIDKLDWDQLIDEYADSLGVPPATVLTDDAVAAIRDARAKLQAQAQQMAAMQQGADTAKALSETKLEGDSALTTMLRGVGVR